MRRLTDEEIQSQIRQVLVMGGCHLSALQYAIRTSDKRLRPLLAEMKASGEIVMELVTMKSDRTSPSVGKAYLIYLRIP